MSVYRDVFLFRSADPEYFYADRKPRKGQEYDPDKHVDCVRYDDCVFTMNGFGVTKIVDRKHGNTYYINKMCQIFQG